MSDSKKQKQSKSTKLSKSKTRKTDRSTEPSFLDALFEKDGKPDPTFETFIASIRYILNNKGYSNSKFFICEINKIEFFVKLSIYRKTVPELYLPDKTNYSPHDAELKILQLFKEKFIDTNITPCILELLAYKKFNENPVIPPGLCDKLILDDRYVKQNKDIFYQYFCNLRDLQSKGLAYDKYNFLVLEECNITLHDYIQKYLSSVPIFFEIFKALLFMIIYTIKRIKLEYPSFTHGDLHTENIMLLFDFNYDFSFDRPKYLVFNFEGAKYCIPYFGMIPKIIDFGFSSIAEENIINSITLDKIISNLRTKNDILFLLHDIYHTAGNNQSLAALLESLDPTKSFTHFNLSYMKKIENKIPDVNQMFEVISASYKNKKIPPNTIFHEYS
jgi:serine/threonine protein kinase